MRNSFLIHFLLLFMIFSCVPKVEETDTLDAEKPSPVVKNITPSASAGSDKTMKLPTNSIVLNGSGSDPDGTIVSFEWSKRSGLSASLSNSQTSNLSLSGLVEGTHTFRLTVQDNLGAIAYDEVNVVVQPADVVVVPNVLPVVNTGSDKTITLPTNSLNITATASDSDGSIVSYSWTKLNGPTLTLQDSNKITVKLLNLVQGVYNLRLTVQDNSGGSKYDDVKVTVNPAPVVNQAPVITKANDISLVEGESKVVQIEASDPDNDSITITLNFAQALNDFVSFTDNGNGTGTLTINSREGDGSNTSHDISAVASDGLLNSVAKTFKLTISPKPQTGVYRDVECKLKANGGECDYFLYNISENLYSDNQNRVLKDKSYPGKTICVEANRSYKHLGFTNVRGEAGQPVTIINCGGQVKAEKTSASGESALNIFSSRYIRITGTGSTQHQYGFFIKGGTHSVNVSKGASDFEIDHIEISGFGATGAVYGGLMAKTYPDIYNDCNLDYNRGVFTQWNTILHDNYIHDVSGEAIYVGTSHYQLNPSPTASTCSTAEQKAMREAPLRHVRVYNNRIENIGRDGIQVGGAIEDSEIHHNIVKNFAVKQAYGHGYGIILNPGTIGKVYNNWVEASPTIVTSTSLGYHGGEGDVFIYNNVFLNSSTALETGGHMNDPNSKFLMSNNTFVIKNTGIPIRLHCPSANIAYFEMQNNIFTGFKTYADQPSGPGGVFQMIRANGSKCRVNGVQYGNQTDETKLAIPGNFYSKSVSAVGFVNSSQNNYHLQNGASAQIDGFDYSSIYQVDYEENSRFDFIYGAFE